MPSSNPRLRTADLHIPSRFAATRNAKRSAGQMSDPLVGLGILAISALAVYALYTHSVPAQPLPETGVLFLRQPAVLPAASAPFSVASDRDNPSQNYFIKVSDWSTKIPVATFFVRGGEVAIAALPLGEYRVTVAQGKSWYGPQHLFGAGTVVNEGLTPSRLYQSGPRQTTGVTLTLTPKFAGNYPMRPAARSEISPVQP